jgi:hypothetical protein
MVEVLAQALLRHQIMENLVVQEAVLEVLLREQQVVLETRHLQAHLKEIVVAIQGRAKGVRLVVGEQLIQVAMERGEPLLVAQVVTEPHHLFLV